MLFTLNGLATKTRGANSCAWLDKYIAMRLFQSLDASPFASREYSNRRMFRGQSVIPGGLTEASQKFLREVHILRNLFSYEHYL
jgi:hypothetical protein